MAQAPTIGEVLQPQFETLSISTTITWGAVNVGSSIFTIPAYAGTCAVFKVTIRGGSGAQPTTTAGGWASNAITVYSAQTSTSTATTAVYINSNGNHSLGTTGQSFFVTPTAGSGYTGNTAIVDVTGVYYTLGNGQPIQGELAQSNVQLLATAAPVSFAAGTPVAVLTVPSNVTLAVVTRVVLRQGTGALVGNWGVGWISGTNNVCAGVSGVPTATQLIRNDVANPMTTGVASGTLFINPSAVGSLVCVADILGYYI